MINQLIKRPVALLALIAIASTAAAQSPDVEIESANRINIANELLREGQIDEAIEGYREVRPAESNRDELNYNLAVAQYRKGDADAAKSLFSEVAASSDSSLASNSRYNLGNCFYADAVKLAEQDKPAAIESLREAISHYRGSLRGNPNNADARANIELAAELIRKLQEEQNPEEQQKQQQQDQQQQDQQQNQDQPQPSSDQNQGEQQQDNQQQQSEQDSESKENDSQQGDQQQQSDQQKSDQSQDKPSDSQESQGNQSKADQAENEDAMSDEQLSENQSAEQLPEQPSEQQTASKQDSQDQSAERSSQQHNMQPRDADQQQPSEEEVSDEQQAVPAGDLTAAGEQDKEDQPAGKVVVADPNAKDGLMTEQEALKMLQAVRDRDMLRRLRQEQIERSRHVTVDRDW